MEALLDHRRRRLGRQDLAQRRAVEALGPGEVGAARDQQRPAVAHVAGDIVEIVVRQDAAPLVAVEDDQVELVDLLHEQLLRREGDQRELEHRHEVLLLRRPQDGEMHEVDRRVRLQQVPPGPLARIGLARDQQHPQPVAHAVDRDDRRVVAVGQLARRRRRRHLQHVDPAALQRHRQLDAAVDRHLEAQRLGAVERDQQRHVAAAAPAPRPRSSTRSDRLTGSSTIAKAGAVSTTTRRSQSSALPVRSTCTGPGKASSASASCTCAVGDEDRPGDAVGRQLGGRLGQRRQEQRAVLAAVGDVHLVHLEPAGLAEPPELGLEPGERRRELRAAVADPVRGAVVEHDDGDVRHRRPVLLPERRPGQRREQHQRREPAQPPAGQPAPERDDDPDERDGRQHRDQRQRQQRIEDHRLHRYCPSRSSSAGTCTWSDL